MKKREDCWQKSGRERERFLHVARLASLARQESVGSWALHVRRVRRQGKKIRKEVKKSKGNSSSTSSFSSPRLSSVVCCFFSCSLSLCLWIRKLSRGASARHSNQPHDDLQKRKKKEEAEEAHGVHGLFPVLFVSLSLFPSLQRDMSVCPDFHFPGETK